MLGKLRIHAYIHTHYYSEHAHKLASLHGALAILISLVLRRLHQQLVSKATFDLPDILQAVPAGPESARKRHAVSSNSFAYWLFHAITFQRKVFSKLLTYYSKTR